VQGPVDQKREELGQICRQYRVRRLELFGSAAGEGFRPQESDVDFLVEFLPLQPGQFADAYFGLLEALERLFASPVDLVMAEAVRNPYFMESIARTRRLVYAT